MSLIGLAALSVFIPSQARSLANKVDHCKTKQNKTKKCLLRL